jgi:hypothetical protein
VIIGISKTGNTKESILKRRIRDTKMKIMTATGWPVILIARKCNGTGILTLTTESVTMHEGYLCKV